MSLKNYYQNCIDDLKAEIEDNSRKIDALESIKALVSNEKSNEEQYLSENADSIAKLLEANSVGVITYGEELKQRVSYGEYSRVLSKYDSVNTRIDQKIEQLREESFNMENNILQFRDEIQQIEEEENKENNSKSTKKVIYKWLLKEERRTCLI